jgi:hypothetical protein
VTPPAEPIEGESHSDLIAPLIALAAELGYHVEIRDLTDLGPRGWCDPNRHEIVVAAGPANRQVRTLVHEIAHALDISYEHYGRERAEVLVDSVVFWRRGQESSLAAGAGVRNSCHQRCASTPPRRRGRRRSLRSGG